MFLALAPNLLAPSLASLGSLRDTLRRAATPPPSPPPSPSRDLYVQLADADAGAPPVRLAELPDAAESDLLVRMLLQRPGLAARLELPAARIPDMLGALLKLPAPSGPSEHGRRAAMEGLLLWLVDQPAFGTVVWGASDDLDTVDAMLRWERALSSLHDGDERLRAHGANAALRHFHPLALIQQRVGSRAARRVLARVLALHADTFVISTEVVMVALLGAHAGLLELVYEKKDDGGSGSGASRARRTCTPADEAELVRWCGETGRVYSLERFVRAVQRQGRALWEWCDAARRGGFDAHELEVVRAFW